MHRRRLGRRENFAILKRIVEESDHIQRNGPKETRESKTRARPARKEVKKTWRAKEQNARNEVGKMRTLFEVWHQKIRNVKAEVSGTRRKEFCNHFPAVRKQCEPQKLNGR
ncbi:hypothetical protein P692DRAFT_20743126 [Suillus brevipes Sb2]|nr:hypothetical protein P692DRAFT_20743126 [Suillus brevipes Sb2]